MQIIILGMHRSGTSSVTRLINMMGAYLAPEGQEMPSQPDNPKGFWERADVMQLNDEILHSAGGTWDEVAHLDFDKINTEQKDNFRKRIQAIVLGMDAHRPWVLKDPRMCLVYPFWKPALEVPVSLFVYRNPIQIAQSLSKRNNIPFFTGIALWEYYTVTALKAAQGTKLLVTRYEDIMGDPVSEVERLTGKLEKAGVAGLRVPSKEEITSFITPDLCHNKEDSGLFPDYLNSNQLDLIRLFATEALTDASLFKISESSIEILSDYFSKKQQQKEFTAALESKKQSEEELTSLKQEYDEICKKLTTTDNALEDANRNLTENGKCIREHTAEIEDANRNLAENGKYISKQTAEIEEAKRNLADKEKCISEQTAEIEEVRHEYDRLSQQHSSLHIKHEDLTQLYSSLQEEYDKAVNNNEAIRNVCELLNCQIKSLQVEFGQEQDKVAQFNSWLLEIDRDVRDIFSSFRWKAGNTVSSLIELMLLRFNQRTAKDHIEEILNEYANFLAGIEQSQLGNKNQIAKENANRWDIFCRLTLAALKNPAQTARLLDAERLKNLYITMFKQSPHVQENIFDYYLKLYGEPTTPSHQNPLAGKETASFHDKPFTLPKIDDPLVSIIIPVYNQWEYTRKCIYSVAKSAVGIKYEIILADDHSTDDTVKAAEFFPGLKVVKTPVNSGFLKNCNNAASHAAGDYLVFLNNDTIVHENWLQALLEVMENPRVGMTGSKLIYPDGKLQEAGGIIWNDASGWNFGRLDNPEKPEYNYVKEVDYISGASLMIRTDLWEEIGGFDEHYVPAYFEDSDLAFEVRKKGFKVIYQPRSVVIHFEGQSHGTDEGSGIKRYQQDNRKKFVEKWEEVLGNDHFPNGEHLYWARDRSRTKKSILVVDHYVPHFDKDAGSKTMQQYLKLFVEIGFNVKFLGDNFYKHEPYTSYLESLGIEVLYGPWYQQNFKKWFKSCGKYFDYVYLHRPHIAVKYIDIVRELSAATILYNGVDLHYIREIRQYAVEKKKELFYQARRSREKEFSLMNKSDVVLTISEKEKKIINNKIPGKKVFVIPTYLYDEKLPLGEATSFGSRQGLLFVGGFGHPPNTDAVIWFIKEIFPDISRTNNDITLFVVGSNPPDEIKDFDSDKIKIMGFVPDDELEALYSSTRVAIAPLRYGSGVKGKIIESIAYALPIVTTKIGIEGIPDISQLPICPETDRYSSRVIELYENEKEWTNLRNSMISYSQTHLTTACAKKILSEILQ